MGTALRGGQRSPRTSAGAGRAWPPALPRSPSQITTSSAVRIYAVPGAAGKRHGQRCRGRERHSQCQWPPMWAARPRRSPLGGGPQELIVVTILVAAEGAFRLPKITSRGELKAALAKLGSIPEDDVLAVEVGGTGAAPGSPKDLLRVQTHSRLSSWQAPAQGGCWGRGSRARGVRGDRRGGGPVLGTQRLGSPRHFGPPIPFALPSLSPLPQVLWTPEEEGDFFSLEDLAMDCEHSMA